MSVLVDTSVWIEYLRTGNRITVKFIHSTAILVS